MCLLQPFNEPAELAILFKRRIDQNEPALFLWGQMGAKRQPSVQFQNASLEIAVEEYLQGLRILRMKLDRRQPVLLAQKPPGDQWRAGIGLDLAGSVVQPGSVEIRTKQRRDFGCEGLACKPADAAEPLAGPCCLLGRQIVQADAGMRVDDPERRVLALQIFDDTRQRDVLDDVGKISRVIGMPVVHEGSGSVSKRDGAHEIF